jgi:hypothetical protein
VNWMKGRYWIRDDNKRKRPLLYFVATSRKWIRIPTIAVFLFIPGVLWADASPEESKPSASFGTAFFSQYIFRGYEQSKNSIVIRPSFTVGYKGFKANLWGNLDTNDQYTKPNKANWNEADLTLSYSRDIGPIKLSGGYIYYALEGVDDSQELFLKMVGKSLTIPAGT